MSEDSLSYFFPPPSLSLEFIPFLLAILHLFSPTASYIHFFLFTKCYLEISPPYAEYPGLNPLSSLHFKSIWYHSENGPRSNRLYAYKMQRYETSMLLASLVVITVLFGGGTIKKKDDRCAVWSIADEPFASVALINGWGQTKAKSSWPGMI